MGINRACYCCEIPSPECLAYETVQQGGCCPSIGDLFKLEISRPGISITSGGPGGDPSLPSSCTHPGQYGQCASCSTVTTSSAPPFKAIYEVTGGYLGFIKKEPLPRPTADDAGVGPLYDCNCASGTPCFLYCCNNNCLGECESTTGCCSSGQDPRPGCTCIGTEAPGGPNPNPCDGPQILSQCDCPNPFLGFPIDQLICNLGSTVGNPGPAHPCSQEPNNDGIKCLVEQCGWNCDDLDPDFDYSSCCEGSDEACWAPECVDAALKFCFGTQGLDGCGLTNGQNRNICAWYGKWRHDIACMNFESDYLGTIHYVWEMEIKDCDCDYENPLHDKAKHPTRIFPLKILQLCSGRPVFKWEFEKLGNGSLEKFGKWPAAECGNPRRRNKKVIYPIEECGFGSMKPEMFPRDWRPAIIKESEGNCTSIEHPPYPCRIHKGIEGDVAFPNNAKVEAVLGKRSCDIPPYPFSQPPANCLPPSEDGPVIGPPGEPTRNYFYMRSRPGGWAVEGCDCEGCDGDAPPIAGYSCVGSDLQSWDWDCFTRALAGWPAGDVSCTDSLGSTGTCVACGAGPNNQYESLNNCTCIEKAWSDPTDDTDCPCPNSFDYFCNPIDCKPRASFTSGCDGLTICTGEYGPTGDQCCGTNDGSDAVLKCSRSVVATLEQYSQPRSKFSSVYGENIERRAGCVKKLAPEEWQPPLSPNCGYLVMSDSHPICNSICTEGDTQYDPGDLCCMHACVCSNGNVFESTKICDYDNTYDQTACLKPTRVFGEPCQGKVDPVTLPVVEVPKQPKEHQEEFMANTRLYSNKTFLLSGPSKEGTTTIQNRFFNAAMGIYAKALTLFTPALYDPDNKTASDEYREDKKTR